jgi:hypothetical protein
MRQGKTKKLWMVTGVAFLLMGQPVLGSYTSIQHNLIDGMNDTNFDAGTGMLTWHSESNNMTLNDGGVLPGVITNTTVDLTTNFSAFDGTDAIFTGGFYSLTFDHGNPMHGNPASSYEISGPIVAMKFEVDTGTATPTFSQIDGEGQFTATTVNLPGSGVWSAAGNSSIDSLTLAFGVDLTNFLWNEKIGGRFGQGLLQTQYSIVPSEVAFPEPASLGLLLLGSIGLLCRRARRA